MNESMYLDTKPTPSAINFTFREQRNKQKEIGRMFTTWCPRTMSFDYYGQDGAKNGSGHALGIHNLEDPREDLRNN